MTTKKRKIPDRPYRRRFLTNKSEWIMKEVHRRLMDGQEIGKIVREVEVSKTTIYRWINKFGWLQEPQPITGSILRGKP
jgi:transposase-like protein